MPNTSMLPPANIVQVVCSRADSLIRSDLRNSIAIEADLYVAMLLRRNTTCSREQMRYLLLSAIRHRFVPALIVVLTTAPFACICRFIIAALVKRRTAIADSARIRISTIQSPVWPCRENARYCGEQKQNRLESAIRRRFVPALAWILVPSANSCETLLFTDC